MNTSITPAFCGNGGFSGTATATGPRYGSDQFTAYLQIKSDGTNSNSVLWQSDTGLVVDFTDNFAVEINFGGSFSRFVFGGINSIVDRYVWVVIVRRGSQLRDWKVYVDGIEAVVVNSPSSVTDISGLALTSGGTFTFPTFGGYRKNFFVMDVVGNGYTTPDYTNSIIGFALTRATDYGLYGGTGTITGVFDNDRPNRALKVNRFPTLANLPIIVESPRNKLTNLSLWGGCTCSSNNNIFSEYVEYNYGEVTFTLTGVQGTLYLRHVCTNGYEEETEIIEFVNVEDLIDQVSRQGLTLTYSYSEGYYTLRVDGAMEPDNTIPCSDCSVRHIPYLYTLVDEYVELNPPAKIDTDICSECAADYTCYIYMGFEGVCVKQLKRYSCIKDSVLRLVSPGIGCLGGIIGNGSLQFNSELVPATNDILSITYYNDNQVPRLINIFGSLTGKKFKKNQDITITTGGQVRKLYSQTFDMYEMETDFYSYDFLDVLNQALSSDNLAIIQNGQWVGFTAEDTPEVEDEPAQTPTRGRIKVVLTRRNFIINNDFI